MEDNYREVKKAEPCLKLIHMDQVEVEEIEWLFYPFIPYGKVTIIQGDPGEGKTTVVLQIIAKLTKGEAILSETSEGKSEEAGVEPINEINAPRSGSSHYTFRKAGCQPITIPKHEPIKKIYVEMVKQIVESEAKNDEDTE